MLEKACNIIFAEKRLPKIYRLSSISFLCGIILIIIFPLINEKIHIEEKHLRNTSLFSKNIGYTNFDKYAQSYFYEQTQNDKIYHFCHQIFNNSTNVPYNHIFSYDILSPRGKKYHLIQINLIYDKTLKTFEIMKKSNFVFYSLIRYLSDEDHITWLSKDLQFNYVSKELFDDHPKECFERLTAGNYNKKIEDGKIISAIYNFDLSEIDIEHLYKFLLKIVGVNSELVDIDFYRMVLANFQANFKDGQLQATTNQEVFSPSAKKFVFKILNIFGGLVGNFVNVKDYKDKYYYLLENILNDFFLINNKINTNHLLVTNGYNSILIKTTGKTKPQTSDKQMISCYNLIGTVLIMIKGMTNEQVDLFRGLYFYLLTSPYHCIGYFYLFVLIFMFVREFYNLIDLIYHNEYKYIWTIPNPFESEKNTEQDENNADKKNKVIHASKIVSTLFLVGAFYLYLMVNIETFMKFINEKNVFNVYYYFIGNVFVNQLFILSALRLTKAEEKFIDIILMYLLVLNCWNFVFINIGVGIIMTAFVMSMEFAFINMKKSRMIFLKIFIILFILYCTFGWKDLVITMMNNYLNYNNNIYTIITITVILLTLRLALFIVMIFNKTQRNESWDYDDIDEIGIDIDEDKIEEKKEDENKENDNKDENEDNNENNIINENENDNDNEDDDNANDIEIREDKDDN